MATQSGEPSSEMTHIAPSEPPTKDEGPVARSVPTGLKRRSVILMIVLTIVTFGFYYPTWFLRRRAALNRLDSPRKLQRWPFLVLFAFYVVLFFVELASGSVPVEQTIGFEANLILNLAQLGVGLLIVVQCFFIKEIVEDHCASRPEDSASISLLVDRTKLSGLLTFFFQIYYLQYAINRYIVGR